MILKQRGACLSLPHTPSPELIENVLDCFLVRLFSKE
jgi:hypothetical protein